MAASGISSWADAAEEQEQILTTQVNSLKIQQSTTRGSGAGDSNGQVASPAATTKEDDDKVTPAEQSIIQKILRTRLVETSQQKLEVIRKDPSSPLYSAKTFEELNLRPELLKGVYAMGFNSPSKIQEAALPLLLSKQPMNLIAQSQSGTGKTAAFVLAMLSRVDPNEHYPQVLCLSPTYELAIQTGEVLKTMGKFCPEISVIFAVKQEQVPHGEKIRDHIIIGTPGKVTDWAFRSRVFDLAKIKAFVLDEADVMIATQGYGDQSIKVHRKLPKSCQMMLFSATYDDEVMRFAENLIPDATVMKLRKEEESLDNIKQFYIDCKNQDDKYRAIANIYGAITIGGAIIFCQTRRTAAWLSQKLTQDGHSVALLSGDLDVTQRIAVLTRFRESREKILITTNVLARGIDVEQVSLVVNYDIPTDVNFQPDCETYLHRIGRTGRFGKMGLAINLVDSGKSRQILNYIQAHFKVNIKKLDAENIEELEQLESS
ncbi:ATP-dependent RNA helicase DDX19A [Folsomia candida]|nr:ATP-dependent RNA helicase DDX19A [Folsomia candida]